MGVSAPTVRPQKTSCSSAMVSMLIRCSLRHDDTLLSVRQGDRNTNTYITNESKSKLSPGGDHDSSVLFEHEERNC